MMRTVMILLAILLFAESELLSQNAFPGAEGFGAKTRSAYGGSTPPKILFVNSLQDTDSGNETNGKGTLRWCLTRSYPRIVLFEVGGTIVLEDIIKVDDPFLFVAGQSAPSPGILIINATIVIKTHDVLFQHLSIRAGDNQNGSDPKGRDCIALFSANCNNVIIDHCSLLWAVDENISIWGDGTPIGNFTISKCIIAQGLHHSIHPEGEHSKGLLVGYRTQNVSILKNFIAHNDDRNPLLQGGSVSEIINNIIYNGINAISFENNIENSSKSTIINNTIKKGNDFEDNYIVKLGYLSRSSEVFISGNSGTLNDWDFVSGRSYEGDVRVNVAPVNSNSVKVIEKDNLDDYILENVGSRPWERNKADQKVLDSYVNGDGQIIDCVDDNDCTNSAGGWYLLGSSSRPLVVPDNPHGDDDLDGFTNVEEWISAFPMQSTTNIDAIKEETDYIIFPNPSNGVFKIIFPAENELEYSRLKVISLQGKTILETIIDMSKTKDRSLIEVDLSNIQKGIYILCLISNHTVKSKKMIIT